MSVLVEICACSAEDVVESEKGGAHRVELCSALPLGGLTPSAGLIAETKSRSKLPVMVMIRPRSGGFCYSEEELSAMERDIEISASLGADGFVFGILTADGKIDSARTKRLVQKANGLPTVHHRAFDVTPNPFEALKAIIDLGIDRLLTSGQRPFSLEGADLIKELIDKAGDRIEIMPGGGIRPHNIAELVSRTGCKWVHLAAHKSYPDTSTKANTSIAFGSDSAPSEDHVDVIDCSVVAAVVSEASQL